MPFATNDDIRLHYELHGAGDEVIVLIPGLGLAGTGLNAVTTVLQERFRVLVVDPRGSGTSDAPDVPYTPDTVAADLAAILDDAKLDQVHVVGLSMGGLIAQDFAIAQPDRVNTLTMLSTWASSDQWITDLMEIRRDIVKNLGIREQFRLSFMLVSSAFAYREIPEQLAALRNGMGDNAPDTQAYLRQIDYCLQHDRTAALTELRIPSLVITGSHDFLTPVTLGEDLATALSGRFEVIEKGSHIVFIECPTRIAELIADFVTADR